MEDTKSFSIGGPYPLMIAPPKSIAILNGRLSELALPAPLAQPAMTREEAIQRLNAAFQPLVTFVKELWENFKRALTPIFNFFRRLVRRLVHHFAPLTHNYKLKPHARQRPLSTRRMMVARRKMLAEIANISQEAGEY